MPLYGFQDSKPLGSSLPQARNDPLASRELERLVFHNACSNKRASPSFVEALQRKIRPLPSAKRIRVLDHSENHEQDIEDEQQQQHTTYDNYTIPPASPQIRPQAAARTTSSALLSPCHICHRKPTRKSDLDSFADCEGCGQRTCYVCIRQCQGWLPHSESERVRQDHRDGADEALSRSFTMHDVDDFGHQSTTGPLGTAPSREQDSAGTIGWKANGHGSVICSRCCVERGSEGDVMCLGCLAGVEGA